MAQEPGTPSTFWRQESVATIVLFVLLVGFVGWFIITNHSNPAKEVEHDSAIRTLQKDVKVLKQDVVVIKKEHVALKAICEKCCCKKKVAKKKVPQKPLSVVAREVVTPPPPAPEPAPLPPIETKLAKGFCEPPLVQVRGTDGVTRCHLFSAQKVVQNVNVVVGDSSQAAPTPKIPSDAQVVQNVNVLVQQSPQPAVQQVAQQRFDANGCYYESDGRQMCPEVRRQSWVPALIGLGVGVGGALLLNNHRNHNKRRPGVITNPQVGPGVITNPQPQVVTNPWSGPGVATN